MLVNFLLRVEHSAETLTLYNIFSSWKHEKKPSKVGYFRKIAEIFTTAKNSPICLDSWKLAGF
jgi:hypothetical protein